MTGNEYTAKDSLAFTEEIIEQDLKYFMRRLNVGSPFTNIPPQEIIDICTNTSFENTERVKGLSKIEIQELNSGYKRILYFKITKLST